MSSMARNLMHGVGVFLNNNHARLDRLDEAMKEDFKRLCDDYDFFDFVIANNGGYVGRSEFLIWFHAAWRFIPKEQLYETYKKLLCDMFLRKNMQFYRDLFLPDLLGEIMALNTHDTVENTELTSLLDTDGYLTVYRGQEKERMRDANSWVLEKGKAIHVGRAYTLLSQSPEFFCVTGKVKLTDVIAFINKNKEHEIMALQRNVKGKIQEKLNTDDYELTFPL